MVKDLTVFQHEQFGSIRTINDGDKVLFCGSDVAKALGYTNPNKAINDHCRAITKRYTPISGKEQAINYIPEGDVYRLIAHSKLPAAGQFESWVFDDVLPMIRKTGRVYLSADAAERIIEDPDLIISLATMVKEQKAQLTEAKPKVEYYDRLIDHGNSLSICDTAKALEIKEKVLITMLIEHEFLYRDRKNRLRPYAEKNKGYFELKEFTTETGNYASVQTLVTVEGRQMLLKLLVREEGKEQAV